ncbi:MAG: hypothetical protein Kapaf2KO_01690 [Candidatus Kapaibacteriales bacterium]
MPFTFENKYEASGIVYPYKEMSVTEFSGGYQIEYKSYLNPSDGFKSIHQPERGDLQTLRYYRHNEYSELFEGDTLLSFFSMQKAERVAELEGRLGVEKANLEVISTGEKVETIDRATKELEWCERQYEIAKDNFDRVKPLVEKGFFSALELNAYQARLKETEGELDLAKKRLMEVNTGEKTELRKLSHSAISRYERELEATRNTIDGLNVTAPFDGVYRNSGQLGFLAGIENRDTLAFIFPLSQDRLSEIEIGMEISVLPYGYDEPVIAKIYGIGSQVKMLQNIPTTMVTAVITKKLELPSGSIAKASIQLEELSFWDYLTAGSKR